MLHTIKAFSVFLVSMLTIFLYLSFQVEAGRWQQQQMPQWQMHSGGRRQPQMHSGGWQQQQMRPAPRQQSRKRMETPDCAALELDFSCSQKCQYKPQFNRGFLDRNDNCRCYNSKDVFYYVDLERMEPRRSTYSLCDNSKSNRNCNYKCKNNEGWQYGYCFEQDVCQCSNKAKTGFYYVKEICYE